MINNASFMVIFPLTFVANTFVPAENLPGPLRTFAEWNPVSAVDPGSPGAVRQHPGRGARARRGGPLQHPVLYTLIWVVVIIAVFAPLSVRRYNRAGRK